MLTRQQGETLAAAIHELRPEWDRAGIYAAIGRCKDRNPFDVAMAAIRLAADPNVRTPGALPTAGDHWAERVSPQVAPRPPRAGQHCHHCGKALSASCCDHPLPRPPRRATDATTYADEARRQMRQETDR